jgi:pimeloyl-ACP methyl ester carboxylesterase
LGDKPLIILTAGPLQLEGLGLSQEQMDQMDEAHTRSQADLTQGSRNSEQIIAEDSGHYIHLEQPDLGIDAIRQVAHAARNSSSI